ncbi:TonB-dependent receptor [Microbulbifer elongatus]|uniref:TonB-dependent receptor n=1 Tax=Microbulbifer elongatus TaxID=86173 RepID=A0ABT1NXM6_9GAMM|nr:TonB-dependent receptor [Microbulbifer elongatus]MCQ3828642.1 TonB-dependent receptor [Microbulbifer elongatus]
MTYKKQILAVAIAMAASTSLMAQEANQQAEEKKAEESSDFSIEEVYVEGVKSAELNARQAERNKDVFSSVITQDDSGNFADQNVAESLQRLPGITLQSSEGEGKFINLRGLGPGFVSVQMNGSEMANSGGGAADSESRGFSLDALPADVLQSIEVLKSLTPDMDLNSIGGSVNVTTISALDRGEDTIKLRAQGAFQEQSGESSPKLTLQGTNIFADETIGFSYSLSYENRVTEGYESRAHDASLPRFITLDGADSPMLIPFELQNRQENAERERIAGIFDLEYRPNDNSNYYARFSNTVFTDEDTALREYYRWGQASDSEVVYLDPANNVFGTGGMDLQQQFFIQESESDTKVFSLGGENLFGNNWALDYEISHSNATQDSPDGRRVQFRARKLSALGATGEDYLNGQIVHPDQLSDLAGGAEVPDVGGFGPSGYQYGETVQPYMLYDNLFMEESFREDTIDQAMANLRKDFDLGPVNYIKTGFRIKNRERNRDKNRVSIVPNDKRVAGCAGDEVCLENAGARLGDFETFMPDNPLFDHAFITAAEAERLIAATRQIADSYDPEQRELESTRNDYEITEDTAAAYIMGEFQVTETGALIAGVRYEKTDFNSTGYLSIRNDREESADQLESFDIAVPLDDTANAYDGFFPSLHYRDELREDLLLRASIWTSFTRPSFDEARAYAQVRDRVIFCNYDTAANLGDDNCSDRPADLQGDIADADFTDAYKSQNMTMSADNVLEIGNPKLDAMTATNFDVSLGWYASENLFIQGAAFYKQIDDFIVEVAGANLNLSDLPYTLPVDQVTMFNIPSDLQLSNAQTYLNGDRAEVYGLEVTYNQYFVEGLLANFFIQSNFTLLHSEADVGDSVRAESIRMPEQADVTVNTTLGWENNDFSVRFITNYRSEILKRIGSCTADDIAADAALGYSQNCAAWSDVYQDAGITYDIKATYNVNDNVKLYLDAVNITDQSNIQYFEGNEYSNGHMMFLSETYGPTYQLGVNVQF